MSINAFLVGKDDAAPDFDFTPGTTAVAIAEAAAAIPVAWLALFEAGDIVTAHRLESKTAWGDDEKLSCASLVKRRDDAIAVYARRRSILLRVFPPYVAPLFTALEKSVLACDKPWIQVNVSDFDSFLAVHPRSAHELPAVVELRSNLAALDDIDLAAWGRILDSAGIKLRGVFGKLKFQDDEVETVIGYVPDEFAVEVHRPESPEFEASKKAALAGDPRAQREVALAYHAGNGVRRSVKTAWEWIRKAADQGYAPAQGTLGTWEHSRRDYTEAVKWWRLAAEQGHSESQHNLGWAYRAGEGLPKDLQLGLAWEQKAADGGQPIAIYTLSVHHDNGEGLPLDSALAFELCKRAAELGFAAAQLRLARKFELAQGVEKNLKQAVIWYQRAADNGDRDANHILGCKYFEGTHVPQDYAKAMQRFLRAAEGAHSGARTNLGYMYQHGLGVTQDLKTAFAYYCQAAPHNATAAYNMATMYRDGAGVEKNVDGARREFHRAKGLGHPDAAKQLEALGGYTGP